MEKMKVKLGSWIPRIAIFSLSCFTLYFVTAPLPIPSLYNLGETRILLVSLMSRIVEEVLYVAVKTSLLTTGETEKVGKRDKNE